MKFAIDKLSLLRPLSHVSSVVERRNTIPILANIIIKAEAGQLSLTATDMEIDIGEQVSCAVSAEGSCTVPAHLLHEIVRKLPEGAEIEFETGEGIATMKAGRSHFYPANLAHRRFSGF